MQRYIAFLRAINVGSHIVKMDRLKQIFEKLKFKNVTTFIASGNVIFETAQADPAALERKIEGALEKELGYRVDTFVRRPDQLIAIVEAHPFVSAEPGSASLYVTFLRQTPAAAACKRLLEFRTEIDDFAVAGSEAFWFCRAMKMSESKFSGAQLEQTLGVGTARNITTVTRIAEKFCR